MKALMIVLICIMPLILLWQKCLNFDFTVFFIQVVSFTDAKVFNSLCVRIYCFSSRQNMFNDQVTFLCGTNTRSYFIRFIHFKILVWLQHSWSTQSVLRATFCRTSFINVDACYRYTCLSKPSCGRPFTRIYTGASAFFLLFSYMKFVFYPIDHRYIIIFNWHLLYFCLWMSKNYFNLNKPKSTM